MTNTNELPAGWHRHKTDRPDIMRGDTSKEPFPVPTLPDWHALPEDLIEAMQDAHSEAAYAYGDEGGGYNHLLELAYFLQSDAFKARYVAVK